MIFHFRQTHKHSSRGALNRFGVGVLPFGLLLGTALLASGFQHGISVATYVGSHFEVREHDSPIKYIFNGNTRLARITNTLLSSNRVQRLRVSPGWNLCSLAVTAPNAHSQLSTLNSQLVVTAAYKWNPNSSGWDPVAPNETLPAGTILWLNFSTNGTLRLTGTYPGPMPNSRAPPEGAFLPSGGLEVWSPDFSRYTNAIFSTFESPSRAWSTIHPSTPFLTNFPPALGPGQAFYAQSLVPVEFELPDPALSLRFYHQDHLGSSSCLTDAQGNLIEEAANYPFGHPRNQHQSKGLREPYLFTQKERNAESGLYYFEARYLAANLGRFIRVDPAFPSRPQELNVYAYCANRATTHIDPTGMAGMSLEDFPEDENSMARARAAQAESFPWIQENSKPVFRKVKEEIEAVALEEINNENQVSAFVLAVATDNVPDSAAEAGIQAVGGRVARAALAGVTVLGGKLVRRLWTSTAAKTSAENAFSHWQKHKAEFPEYKNAKQYVDGAKDFFSNPPAGTLTKVRPNGDKLFYNPANNTFGVQAADGAPRTMFRPTDGIKYWDAQ